MPTLATSRRACSASWALALKAVCTMAIQHVRCCTDARSIASDWVSGLNRLKETAYDVALIDYMVAIFIKCPAARAKLSSCLISTASIIAN